MSETTLQRNRALVEDSRRWDVLEVLRAIRLCVDNREPFSLVRLGDGEGALLGYPERFERPVLDEFLMLWFGTTEFSSDDIEQIRSDILFSVRNADIVGLPSVEWQSVDTRCEAAAIYAMIDGQRKAAYTYTSINHLLEYWHWLWDVVHGAPFCGLVSCHALSSTLKQALAIGHVEEYFVPGERGYQRSCDTPHYPDRYRELEERLSIPYRGAFFLVGAGPLGKIYCQWIKDRGGIAVDIGSVMDGWAGMRTRERIRRALEFYDLGSYRMPELSLKPRMERFRRALREAGLSEMRYVPRV